MNQEIHVYLRAIVTYAQTNWSELLPAPELAINNRDSSLGYSPFFLTHGLDVSLFSFKSIHPYHGQTENLVKFQQANILIKKLEEN